MISKTGKLIVRIATRMDPFARREDGSETPLLADQRFDNHSKMTITGIVVVGTHYPDENPLEDADRLMPRCHYYPTPYIGGGVFDIDFKKGDQVWFHYLCAENTDLMERNADGSWNVTMQVSDIFCRSRNGALFMNQNWVWGEQVKDTSLVAVDAMGYLARAALSPTKGIEIVPGVTLDPYVDEARVLQIDSCRYRSLHYEVRPTDRVYLAKDAGFPNVIRNRKGLLFRHSDILALYHQEPSKVVPVGKIHLVKVLETEYKSTFIKHTLITIAPEWGRIVASGCDCTSGVPGNNIIFSRRWTRLLSKEYYLVEDGEIQAHIE